jgi:hypothetical protein
LVFHLFLLSNHFISGNTGAIQSAEELPIDVRAIANRHAFRLHTDERMHEDIAQLTEQIVRMIQNEAGSSKKATRSASE